MRIAATILILTAAAALASPWHAVIARKKANAGVDTPSGIEMEIGDDGWDAYVTIPNMTTGGTYAFGFDASNVPTNPAIVLSVTSPGYTDAGVSQSVARTVWATSTVRLPYPDEDDRDESVADSTNVRVRVSLSDFVHTNDTITGVALAGWYDDGGASPAGTVAVTNLSTLGHPIAIANWSWPGWSRIESNSFPLRVVAFHRSGQDGRPVRAVRFTAHDESGATNVVWATSPEIDDRMSDPVPVIEYVVDMPATNLAQGDLVTCHFAAFPWVGDSAAVMDTATSTNTMPTALYAPQYWLCDRLGTYGLVTAVVATNGNNGTGVVVSNSLFDAESPPAAFATINGAAAAIASANNSWWGRNDTGGGTIYLQAGEHDWTGGSASVGSVPETWTVVAAFPGESASTVELATTSNDRDLSDKVLIRDVALTANATWTFDLLDYLWLDGCSVELQGLTPFYRDITHYWTGCDVLYGKNMLSYSSTDAEYALVRGNTFSPSAGISISPRTFIGNLRTNVSAGAIWFVTQDTGAADSDGSIIAYNKIAAMDAATPVIDQNNWEPSVGLAIVQNQIEDYRETGGNSAPLVQLADSSDGQVVNNILYWHNTVVGQRHNMAYNSTGTQKWDRLVWSVVNNSLDDNNTKHDDFAPASSNRTGGWPVLYAVGDSGNFHGNVNGIGASGFAKDFAGVSSLEGAYATNYADYVDNQAWDGTSNGAGNGDYTPTTNSVLVSLPTRWLLPFDLAGNVRTNGADAAGAYVP